MNKTTATRLATQIFNEFDKQIVEATTGTDIPPKFIAGLVGNEAGKDKAGRIVRDAIRFEPGVYKHLIAVRDGLQPRYGNIVRGDIRDASDAAIRALATSYEATQIMGYHVIKSLHCTIADLRNPDKHFHYTVKLLQLNGYPKGADNAHMANEMRQWNTGLEGGRTYHADYVPNAEAVRAAYSELEKTRSHRTLDERLAGAVVPDREEQEEPYRSTIIEIPGNEPEGETPTGDTGGDPPKTEVQPTKLKGWAAALSGFGVSVLTAVATWFAGLPPIVQASIFIGGGLATSSLVGGVIWIKNQREERAAQKELAIIAARGSNV